jgi:hypothetical protein
LCVGVSGSTISVSSSLSSPGELTATELIEKNIRQKLPDQKKERKTDAFLPLTVLTSSSLDMISTLKSQ